MTIAYKKKRKRDQNTRAKAVNACTSGSHLCRGQVTGVKLDVLSVPSNYRPITKAKRELCHTYLHSRVV